MKWSEELKEAILNCTNESCKTPDCNIEELCPAKDTENKPNWSLINLKDIEGIVRIREFGIKKYKDPDNWQKVDPVEYVNAIKRHLVEMDEKGIYSLDRESGMPHIWHIGCNYNFLSHFERKHNEACTDRLLEDIHNG